MPSRYVFHAAITLAAGADALVPVAELANIDPAAHATAMSKYEDSPERRRLARTMVPVIERRWTEVVFLAPVHPHAFWSAWREITGEELPAAKFWQIPIGAVPEDAVVFDRSTSAVGEPIHKHEVVPLDRSSYRSCVQTIDANRAWLSDLAERGHRGAWFNRTPTCSRQGRFRSRQRRRSLGTSPPTCSRAPTPVDALERPSSDGTACDGSGFAARALAAAAALEEVTERSERELPSTNKI